MLPDFLIIGAPKAGTTALHAALAQHPEIFMSPIKEPKFFMCDGRRPRPQSGPGDAHSVREWIWRRSDYERLFERAPEGVRRGESTPFYLYDRASHIRMAELVPNARLIVVIRDPVDRAYSNWLHLWSDGLETVDRFVEACAEEADRIAAGWAPFWHYTRLGLYGAQLAHLYRYFPGEQVHILRYKELVDTPDGALDDICRFLEIGTGIVDAVPPENSRPFVLPTARNRALATGVRLGAAAGVYAPPRVWRALSAPLVRSLQRDGTPRPTLPVPHRRFLVQSFADDIRRLEQLTGRTFESWLADQGRGDFATRRPLQLAH